MKWQLVVSLNGISLLASKKVVNCNKSELQAEDADVQGAANTVASRLCSLDLEIEALQQKLADAIVEKRALRENAEPLLRRASELANLG